MPRELDSRYHHTDIEHKWYQKWESAGVFRPDYVPPKRKLPAKRKPFSIVIPPPNVTGQLHVGHALNHTVQDVITRAARKRGFETLWLPGTDHAGIATQARVEKMLKEEQNTDRHTLGREQFLERVWEWKEKYGNAITSQIRTMGQSVDWSRERFTMDEGLSRAVTKVFVDLYKKGLVYRDTRMVNWDPVARTVLSDLEVEYEEGYQGELWSFAYPLSDGSGEIVVATTRPETMLGDTAIAVHPEDLRYKKLIGHTVRHPLLDRLIPIIGDEVLVEMEFGTGAVKVTPAHDPNDFEVGRRHDLEFITIFDEAAAINENGGSYRGLDRVEARKKIKEDLIALGLERGSEPHTMAIGKSQRSGAIVEPLISTQWFVKIHPLAEPAIEAVEKERIKFVPKTWENLYFSWMREIRDWCISRQLWWGHRIPAWYGPDQTCFVAMTEDEARAQAKSHFGKDVELRRDEDVLDTWFSSALWPFSTMGWPENTQDLKKFYPTTVLVTAFDILFFWVARMIMLGIHFMNDVPFDTVYIHGLMRDEKGRKISKSLGNNIDPADIIENQGADAYRFFLMATLSEGKDTTYSESRLKGYQNFANKVWNSSRFVLMNLPEDFKPLSEKDVYSLKLEAEDHWILHRRNETIRLMEKYLDEYKFQLSTETIYSFVWNNFCDWYIEFIKPRLYGKMGDSAQDSAQQVSFFILNDLLAMLHPFMPFITEELHSYLVEISGKNPDQEEYLITSPWPETVKLSAQALEEAKHLEAIQEAIQGARSIRADTGIAPDKKVKIVIQTESVGLKTIIEQKTQAISRLASAEEIKVDAKYTPGKFDAMEPFVEGQVYVPLDGVLDIQKEVARLNNDLEKLKKQMEGIEKKLGNEKFLEKAPADVVDTEKGRLVEMQARQNAILESLKRFGG